MGILFSQEECNLDALVYRLSEALRGAIEAGDSLQHSICVTPKLAPDMDCSQIADQLASFRRQTNELWGLEVLLLTKILRARDLAKDLRFQAPRLRPEVETFRLATVMAEDLLETLMPAKETSFNGVVQPRQFLESRGHRDLDDGGIQDALPGYRIAGLVDVRLLIDACETLNYGIAASYGFETPAARDGAERSQTESISAGTSADEPFLLSELGEIIADPLSNLQHDRPAVAVRHSYLN